MASSSSTSTLLFLNLPPRTFVGLDLVSFDSSPQFYGIKNIPAGLHFIYTGTDASLSIRHGRWLNFPEDAEASVYTLKWTSEDESLELLQPTVPDTRASPRGLVDYAALIDATANLAEKQDAATNTSPSAGTSTAAPTDFPPLTSHITSTTLTRILSASLTISSISSAPRDSDAEHIPGLSHLETSEAISADAVLNVLDIDLKRTWSQGDVGSIRTERARDRSWYLSQLIDAATDEHSESEGNTLAAKEILGELQFYFLMVLTLANYSCLEQWKRLLSVLLTCEKALDEVEGYFVEVLRILELQLRHADDVEGGLFELRDEVGCASLRHLLSAFGDTVRDTVGENGELSREVERFERDMRERFGWEGKGDVVRRGMVELEDGERVEVSLDGVDEDEERGEYAPVVVEL